ncbi:ABC transporter substrate-binding protein [Castellaniella sp.]|uniref:ABC transporter substrate-binding protein n=1 Tax=Castellaniella sp. TaxID=1955812 RepID=UPI003C77DA11
MKPLPILRYLAGGVLVAAGTLAHAETLTVTHWGSGMYGAPFAVALEKGYFKDEGLDITGFITSKGGGTTVRNAMASEIPYGEVALSAAVAAAKSGVKLTIVHGGVISLADLIWVANKGSAISKIEDMKGKKLGYSSPKSVTDMVSTIALNKAGILDSVDRKAVGGLGSALTALRENAVDVIYMLEPVMSKEADTLKVAFTSSASIPHMTQTVGIVQTDYLKEHPDVIKKIIEARRKGVEFIEKHPDEAGDLLAKQYSLTPAIARSAIHSIMKSGSPYWSQGALDYQGMDVMLDGLRLVKALDNEAFNWSTLVDESLLPKDLRSK